MMIVLWLDGFSSADWSPLPPAAHRPSVHTQWLATVRELPPDILTPDEEEKVAPPNVHGILSTYKWLLALVVSKPGLTWYGRGG